MIYNKSELERDKQVQLRGIANSEKSIKDLNNLIKNNKTSIFPKKSNNYKNGEKVASACPTDPPYEYWATPIPPATIPEGAVSCTVYYTITDKRDDKGCLVAIE